MRRRSLLGLVAALAAAPACETSRPAPVLEASGGEIAAHLAPRIGPDRALSKLDVRPGRVLLGLSAPRSLGADTDERPRYELALWQASNDQLRIVRSNVRAAALGDSAIFAVTSENVLVRIDPDGGQTALIERAQGKPAVLADGSVAVARASAEPGETDIWLSTGGAARPIAEGPGPDDMPIALPDGRLAFVSGRSGIASLWIADPSSERVTQLTNRGLVPGKPLGEEFVPPPLELLGVSATELRYDAGGDQRWSVELATGAATPLAGRQP
jgi:hypothetical protein